MANTRGDELPQSVRYVKNGAGGKWWQVAKANGQVHAGWHRIPHRLLLKPDFAVIERIALEGAKHPGAAKRDIRALRHLLDAPNRHLWATFEEGCMWRCTVRDGANINPHGQDQNNSGFWLVCDRPWSNHSIHGKLLAIGDLPGGVTRVAGFRATVAVPTGSAEILRIIQDEKHPDAMGAASARARYQQAVEKMVKCLSPKDFEQLIDLILYRTGWVRISTLGKTLEGIDLEAVNLTADEIAFVQVKSTATQHDLSDYVIRFDSRRERYARMIFAVHTPDAKLTTPANPLVQVWTGDRLAQFVVRLGLGEWVESQIA